MKELDLHGVRHEEVERLLENFILLNNWGKENILVHIINLLDICRIIIQGLIMM